MPLGKLAIVCAIFFLTSSVSVVTGSTSLITVPALIAFGVEPHVAIATNMLALIFMSTGGSLPFAYRGVIERRVLPLGVILTVVGSGIGAVLLLRIPTKALQLAIAVAMIAVTVFSLLRRDSGTQQRCIGHTGGYLLTFALAVYGGFFSGGYVTMLTAVFVLLFGLTFLQAVATTKVINVFSSLVATVIFACRGVVDFKLGMVLGLTMFVGALVGGHAALRLPAVWPKRVFVIAVIALAARMILGLVP